MRVTLLVLFSALGCGGWWQTPKPNEPVGCCCSYGRCSPNFTAGDCVSDAEFQGWTYTWHEGACNANDVYPAPGGPKQKPH